MLVVSASVAMVDDYLDWMFYELSMSAIAQPKVRESVANRECGGTSRIT